MVEKLSVQIQLLGAAEIERQLAGVSKAGQKCFTDIQKAAEQAGGFAKLDPTVMTDKFKQLGVTAPAEIAKITAALQQAGKLEGAVLGVANLERGIGKVGTAATAAFGLTRREIGALSRALRAVDLGPIGSQVALIGRVGGAFGAGGIALTAVGVAIAAVGAALVKFAFQAAETEKALTQLQKVSGTSFENLSSLQQVFAAGGTPLKKFADEFGNLSEQVREAGQQAKIRDASKDTVEWANNVSQVKRQFDNLAQGVTQTFSPLTTLETKVQAVKEALAKGPTSMVPGVSDVVSAEQQWSKLADIFKNLASDMDRAQLGKALGLSPESIATLSKGSAAIQQLQAGTVALNSTLSATDQISLQQLTSQWNQLSTAASAFFQSLGAAAAPVISAMLADFTNALNTMQAALNNFSFQSFINGAIAAGNALKYLTIPGLVSKGIQAAGDAAGFAGGGLLGGGGTGTSDSNLAWVSRGEHIMPARTVAQPGVLAFLEALRRSGGNLSAVLNGMGRFALGGMVPRAMPAFASGGLAGGMNHVTIAFPGLPPIGGLRATSAVVDELHKAAALAQVRSGGRKPSRYA